MFAERECVKNCAIKYKKEVLQLLDITIPRLADIFSEQRGALFGFGPKKQDDTGSLLKISKKRYKKRKLNKVAVYNLNEERCWFYQLSETY